MRASATVSASGLSTFTSMTKRVLRSTKVATGVPFGSLGRRLRRQALRWAWTARYRNWPSFRATSRLTVDGARPSARAMLRIDSHA